MLKVRNLTGGHGAAQVLFGIDLGIAPGEAVSLLGRNGMGKTTLVKTIMGLLPAWEGQILFDGEDINHLAAHVRARAGLGLAPEGRQIFANLSVRENLLATARPARDGGESWTLARVHELFPELAARAGASGAVLSGGEQQMLAIGRALMTNPRLLILDEATEGLAPQARARIWQALKQVREAGLSLLIIDKNIRDLMDLAQRHYIVEKGRIVWQGDSAALRAAAPVREKHLGI